MVRFLEKSEFRRTIPLFEQCFGKDPEFEAEYYGDEAHAGQVLQGRIAVLEEQGRILSMVHLKPVLAEYGPAEFGPAEWAEALSGRTAPGEGAAGAAVPVTYLLCIATDPACRHRGYMDRVMDLAEETLRAEGAPWCFLVAVDKEIYRHRGYVYDWPFQDEERELLAADDDFTDCSAKLLNAETFRAPSALTPAGLTPAGLTPAELKMEPKGEHRR